MTPPKNVKAGVRRTRSRNLAIRLSEREQEMLLAVADREQMSVSEAVRWLVRREYEKNTIPDGDRVVLGAPGRSGVRARRA